MTALHCDIVSAEADLYHGDATLVVAHGVAGELGIEPQHIPLLTWLRPGTVKVTDAQQRRWSCYVSGGILEVQPSIVTILADTALRADEVDDAAVKRAQQEVARIQLQQTAGQTSAEAQRRLLHAIERLQALEHLRRKLQR